MIQNYFGVHRPPRLQSIYSNAHLMDYVILAFDMHPLNGKLFTAEEATVLRDIICNRRDVRGNRFLNKPVEESVLQQLLEAAFHAPSVGFSQPWEFVLIKDPSTTHQLQSNR